MRRTSSASVGVLLVLTLVTSTTAQRNDTDDGGAHDAKFFVKSFSTTTWTFLSSFTSTVPYTCYTTGGAAPAACSGRRLHRMRNRQMLMSPAEDEEELDSSLVKDLDNQEKFFFTVWRTASTTATVTTFSTNRSVTISVSIACTYPGIVFNNC